VLGADQRLRRREDFTAAVRGGRRAGRGSLVIHLALPPADLPETPAPPPARAGFVVPRTVGGAVIRNRVRRRLRHLLRERLGELPPGTRLVIRALPGADASAYPEMAHDLDLALQAARRVRS